MENWIKKNNKLTAVPGADNYKNVKQGNFDYMQASGYINFDVVKNHTMIDGEALDGHEREWQRRIGYVPQSAYVVEGFIRRNVAFGAPDEVIDDPAVYVTAVGESRSKERSLLLRSRQT